MNWISVGERVPEGEELVLIVDVTGLISVGTYIDNELFHDFVGDCDYEPTHWMSFPEPPEVC